MPNMSYCRMENTARDLDDCVENWDLDPDTASYEEFQGRKRIFDMAQEIVDMGPPETYTRQELEEG